ncbi:MAG: helix-turn-helix domain-containing protein [Castellaniella sp.]|nr:helix-turn-helix domain-containing protein [Castellaniella sp.]
MHKRKSPSKGAYAGRRGINSKSSATEAQYQRILALLAARPHSTEDLRKAGIFQVSARIKELRMMGHFIKTDRITLTDRDGFPHHGVALYSLGGV